MIAMTNVLTENFKQAKDKNYLPPISIITFANSSLKKYNTVFTFRINIALQKHPMASL